MMKTSAVADLARIIDKFGIDLRLKEKNSNEKLKNNKSTESEV